MAERSGGKLWPVRNQKHLAALGKSFEPFRNLVEGEPADTGFGSRVSRFTGCTVYAPHGGNVDDPSASVWQHRRNGSAAAVEDGGEVTGKHLVPVFISHIHEKPDVGNPGIVYQYIQMVTGLGNRMEDFLHSIRISNVTWHQCTCANLFNFLSGFFQCVKRAGTVQEDMIALSRESKGDRTSDATGRAGNKCIFLCIFRHNDLQEKCFYALQLRQKSTTSSYKYIFIFIIYWNDWYLKNEMLLFK